MNNTRRKAIQKIIERLEELNDEVSSIYEDVEAVFDEEEEYKDNIPENLQGSERYEIAECACDSLENAKCSLDNLDSYLTDAISELEEAMN